MVLPGRTRSNIIAHIHSVLGRGRVARHGTVIGSFMKWRALGFRTSSRRDHLSTPNFEFCALRPFLWIRVVSTNPKENSHGTDHPGSHCCIGGWRCFFMKSRHRRTSERDPDEHASTRPLVAL